VGTKSCLVNGTMASERTGYLVQVTDNAGVECQGILQTEGNFILGELGRVRVPSLVLFCKERESY